MLKESTQFGLSIIFSKLATPAAIQPFLDERGQPRILLRGFTKQQQQQEQQEHDYLVLRAGDRIVLGSTFDEVVELLKTTPRPIPVSFVPSPDVMLKLDVTEDLVLEIRDKKNDVCNDRVDNLFIIKDISLYLYPYTTTVMVYADVYI